MNQAQVKSPETAASLHFQNELHWFVFYTKPKAEFQVQNELSSMGYEVFLPLTKKMTVWKNRQRKLTPHVLFPNYIFVRTSPCNLYSIVNIHGIKYFISCSEKPSVIPDKDIEVIRTMINLNTDIIVETDFENGEKVRVVNGQLAGYDGIIERRNGKSRFGIQIEALNKTILADITSFDLEKL